MLKTEVEHLRGLVFEMLACLSYLRAAGRLPEDVDFTRLENDARTALEIRAEVALKHEPKPKPSDPVVTVPVDTFAPSGGSLIAAAQCPSCGDVSPKTVHLKRRPRGLQCRACGHEYPFPSAWV